MAILLFIPAIKGFNFLKENTDLSDNPALPLYSIFIIGGLTFGSIFFFSDTINSTITGFVNPEYGAMKDIINFVQGVSNGTCNTCH